MSLTEQITGFVQDVVGAMGLSLTPRIEETPDGTHINLEGEDGGKIAPENEGLGIPLEPNTSVSLSLHYINLTEAPIIKEIWAP